MPRDLVATRPQDRRPRVLAVYDDYSGCTLYRVLYPFAHLAQLGYPVYWIRREDLGKVDMRDYDLAVLARLSPTTQSEAENVIRLIRHSGICTVWETDDDLLSIPDWNPASLEISDTRRASIETMMAGVSAMTVTNQALADVCRKYNPNVWILPDCVDPEHWAGVAEHRTVEGLTVGLAGGPSHAEDWKLVTGALAEIAERYPEVQFVLVGYHPDYLIANLPIDRLHLIPWASIYDYPKLIGNIDIGLCPLVDVEFNHRKEPIKAYEYALAGAAVVASPVVYNRFLTEPGLGFRCRTESDWVRAISRLIEKPKLRRQMAAAARAKVLRAFNIHKRAVEWYRVYELIWKRYEKERVAAGKAMRTIVTTPPGFFAQLPQPAVG